MTCGFVFNPPDIVARSLMNTFSTIPDALRAPEHQPRFVIITSMGITSTSHKALPLALKPLYGTMLQGPHEDKLGAERLLAHLRRLPWTVPDEVKKEVLPDGWRDTPGLPRAGEIRQLIIVRPALLSDGPCKGDAGAKKGKGPYRTLKDGDFGDGYRVSRKDIAHFIVCDALPNWEKWEGSGITVAY